MRDLDMHSKELNSLFESPVLQAAYDFMSRYASSYCRYECRTLCCSLEMHLIRVDEPSAPMFSERDVPLIHVDSESHVLLDFSKSRVRKPVYNNMLSQGKIVRLDPDYIQKTGRGTKAVRISEIEIPKPSLVSDENSHMFLYGDRTCPLYSSEQGCTVHDDSRRPSACKLYPLFPQPGVISVKSTCELSRDDAFMNHLKKITDGFFKINIK